MLDWREAMKQAKIFRLSDDDYSELQKKLQEKNVSYVITSWVDPHGVSKCKAMPVEFLPKLMQGWTLYTVSAFDAMGGLGPHDDECQGFPDPDRLTILPWRPDVAWMPCDLYYHDEPYPHCSRVILKRVMEKARSAGFEFMLGIEPEFYVLMEEDGEWKPLFDDKLVIPGYDMRGTLLALPYQDKMVKYMNQLGWNVDTFDHEGGRSQYEFDYDFSDALTTADRLIFFRLMADEVAREMGGFACFMPKPFDDDFGSGAHFNMSIYKAGTNENLFIDPADPRGNGFSSLGYSFIAGLLKHAETLVAMSAPLVNSYKRFTPQGFMATMSWAPVFITYGANNRSAMFRIARSRPALENRVPDISCNVYLAAALHLAAGLEGILGELDPGAPVNENLYKVSDEEMTKKSIRTIPRNLLDSIRAFEADPLSEEVLGPVLKREWIELKKREWYNYHQIVTDHEREFYRKEIHN